LHRPFFMLNNLMEIIKHKESFLPQKYFFVKGKLKDININYFKNKIDEGINLQNNLNGQTNVIGYMTDWKYFTKDIEFFKSLCQIMDYFDSNKFSRLKYSLEEAWGLKENFGNFTKLHNHRNSLWSGVIYLSKIDQPLIFPQIEEKLEAEEGSFAIFSSFLDHKTDNRIINSQTKYAIAFNFKDIESF